jgi:hypothetical protein
MGCAIVLRALSRSDAVTLSPPAGPGGSSTERPEPLIIDLRRDVAAILMAPWSSMIEMSSTPGPVIEAGLMRLYATRRG